MIKLTAVVSSLLVCLTVSLPCVSAPKYKITDLGTLGGPYAQAHAINNKGQVVGQSMNPKGQKRAFLWEKGKMTVLGTFGGTWSSATDINDQGMILCAAAFPTEERRLLVWHNGDLTDIGTFGSEGSFCSGINNGGQAVGSRPDADGIACGFVWEKGKFTDVPHAAGGASHAADINKTGDVIGAFYGDVNGQSPARAFIRRNGKVTDLGLLPGTVGCVAIAINDRGQVVGYCFPKFQTQRRRGFIWENGKMKELGSDRGGLCMPLGINNKGQVVGQIMMKDRRSFAFLWEKGRTTDLNSRITKNSGWTLLEAKAINDSGRIVGTGDRGGETHAFLLSPQP